MTWRRGMAVLGAWAFTACLLAALLATRVQAAHQPGQGVDFWNYFVPAARSVMGGGSPYAVDGYVYSPLLAFGVIPLLATDDPFFWWVALSVVAGIIALWATLRVYSVALLSCRTALLAGIGGVLLFWSYPVTWELFFGQSDLVVLGCLAVSALLACRGRLGLVGAGFSLVALIKTWPGAVFIWLVTRPSAQRWRVIAVGAGVGLAVLGIFMLVLGPSVVTDWVAATRRYSVQEWPSYSAFGLARELFSPDGYFDPVIDSAPLRWATTIVALGLVLVLVVAVCRQAGDPVLALWHVVGLALLAIPVSHIQYTLLFVPIMWIHLTRLRLDPRNGVAIVCSAVCAVWWLVSQRLTPPGTWGLATVVCLTFFMLAVSIGGETFRGRAAAEDGRTVPVALPSGQGGPRD
jgi:hypothetical protein